MRTHFFALRVLAIALLSAAPCAAAEMLATNLRCEYLYNPRGIDVARPRLDWRLESAADAPRGQRQTAYQILVASSPEALGRDQGDLWDSGKVESDQSIQVEYAGKPLASRMRCFWKVRAWDRDGKAGRWSEQPAKWSMGLLSPDDWKAPWIGLDEKPQPPAAADPGKTKTPEPNRALPARMLRKEFDAAKAIAHATAYISGLGYSELYLNGRKIGDHVLDPVLTDYDVRVPYVTYDVTGLVRGGRNAVGVWLGNGRFFAPRDHIDRFQTRTFGYPKARVQIEIEYADGSTQRVTGDATWKITDRGPIRENNDYDGEVYDARLEQRGWDNVGFDDSSWQPAQVVEAPKGRMSAQMMPPMRAGTFITRGIKLTQPKPGVWVYDMGQNFTGWVILNISGPAGSQAQMRFAETLRDDGTLYTANLRSAQCRDIYTLRGDKIEFYQPRFTYHGFRYVELTYRPAPGQSVLPAAPDLSTLVGCVVHTDLPKTGFFECSNPLLNQIFHNVQWGVQSNYLSIPTDCPQRDERQGWQGDRAAESKGETFLFDNVTLYNKWLVDIQDSQKPDGNLSDVCPAYWPFYSANVTWPSAFTIVPQSMYVQFGDRRNISLHYDAMAKWMAMFEPSIRDGLIGKDNYGDWCVPPESPKLIHSEDPARRTNQTLLATSYYIHNLHLLADYARMLGKDEAARRHLARADAMTKAFNAMFLDAKTGRYDNGTQTSCVLPLAFGLAPKDVEAKVFDTLINNIDNVTHGHVGTGLIGGQWLMRTLTDRGRIDLAYKLAANRDYPSWGYMAEHGATTVWELWNGNTADPSMNSGNHVMLVGDLTIWLFEDVAGIAADPAKPGFQHIVMRPRPGGDLTHVKAEYWSIRGPIRSEWRHDWKTSTFSWSVTIPANTTATVYVRATNAESVTELGKPVAQAEGVKFVKFDRGAAVYEIGAGSYRFEAK